MLIARFVVVALFIVATAALPALVDGGGPPLGGAPVSAAPAVAPLLDNDGNSNGNANGNSNANGNGNANRNENNDNEDENGNDNEAHRPPRHLPPPPPPPPPGVVAFCYAGGESGALGLALDGGTATLTVVPTSTFPRGSRVTLAKRDPSAAAGLPGPLVGGIVFDLRAQDGCDGNALAELLADANLGLSYGGPATGARLRIALLDGSRWIDVPTVPDPNPGNPYVSATIRRTGTYALYQAP